MSRNALAVFKDAILILEEVKRLGENIKKLTDRIEALEPRQAEDDKATAVREVREAALIDRFDAATRVAAAEAYAHLVERLTLLESAPALRPGTSEPQARTLPHAPGVTGESRRHPKSEGMRDLDKAAAPHSEASPGRADRDQ